jgi:hypothetical protein
MTPPQMDGETPTTAATTATPHPPPVLQHQSTTLSSIDTVNVEVVNLDDSISDIESSSKVVLTTTTTTKTHKIIGFITNSSSISLSSNLATVPGKDLVWSKCKVYIAIQRP